MWSIRTTGRILWNKSIFSISRHLSYVQQVHILQSLKEDDSLCKDAFKSGKYMLFKKGSAFIDKKSEDTVNKLLNKESARVKDGGSDEFKVLSSPWLSYEDVTKLYLEHGKEIDLSSSSILGNVDDDGTPLFALQLSPLDDKMEAVINSRFSGFFMELTVAMFIANSNKSLTFERGHSLLNWHRHHIFCRSCGGKLERNISGSLRRCTGCSKVYYPEPSPVAITVVTDETRKQCLLVRSDKFPPGLYTAVAGYLEMGENIEETVKREVAEEVGLEVERVEFVSSQHWPLRGTSLMLGFLATVKPGGEVKLDKKELQDARWFTADELKSAYEKSLKDPGLRFRPSLAPSFYWVPPKPTEANALIQAWLKKYS